MLPLIIGGIVVAGGIAAAIYAGFSADTEHARVSYNRAVVDYTKNTQQLIHDIEIAKQRTHVVLYENHFPLLIGYYKSCIHCADNAYRAMQNINYVIKTTYDSINKTKDKMNELYAKAKDTNLPYDERQKYFQELADLKKVKSVLYDTQKAQQVEKEKFLQKVRDFNNQTHDLKLFIRDNTGRGGQLWYERLEARIANKRGS